MIRIYRRYGRLIGAIHIDAGYSTGWCEPASFTVPPMKGGGKHRSKSSKRGRILRRTTYVYRDWEVIADDFLNYLF